jgi:hypothetical protein
MLAGRQDACAPLFSTRYPPFTQTLGGLEKLQGTKVEFDDMPVVQSTSFSLPLSQAAT